VVIHTDFSGNYIEDPIRNFDLVSSGMAHASLHIGINIDIKKYIKKYKRHKLQYYLEFEEPKKFWSKDWMLKLKNSHLFDNIFTLCPFTADYLNDRFYNENKCIPIFFPFNKYKIPKSDQKQINVIYSGLPHTLFQRDLISCVKEFPKHAIISYDAEIATHTNTTYSQKMALYGQSKIAVVHNLLENDRDTKCSDLEILANQAGLSEIHMNKCFRHLEDFKIVPQLKSRLFEAAFSKSLILCKKDPFCLIERYFSEKEDFLYFSSVDELRDLIKNVIQNYSRYEPLARNAFKKAVNNYTTDHLLALIQSHYEKKTKTISFFLRKRFV
jgi:hypothetical protein